jgi:hypothetical protein
MTDSIIPARYYKIVRNGYLDGSILELFANRLPDLTLKKLGEKMNVRFSHDTYGRLVLICSTAERIKFITGASHTDLKYSKFCKSPCMPRVLNSIKFTLVYNTKNRRICELSSYKSVVSK